MNALRLPRIRVSPPVELTMTGCKRLARSGAAAFLLVAVSTATQAQGYAHEPRRGDYVIAESNYGKGTVSGPIRHGQHGLQVRLPGGSWIDCARSCSETLRRQTVDFWESNGAQAKDSGPGYFSWGFRY